MKKSFILALLFTASHVSIAQTEAPLNDFPPTGILWDAIKTQNEINSATADQTAKIAANSNEIVVVKANVASLSNGLVTVEGRTNTWNDVVNKVSTNDATYLATVASASTALQSEADTNAIAQLEAHNVDSISHSALLKGKVGTNHTGAVSITGLLSVFDAGYPNEDGGKIRMAGGMYYGDWGIGLLPINNDMQDPANGHLYLYNRLVQRTIYDSGNFLAGTHYVAPSAITGMVTNNSTATLNLASGSTVATATAGSEPVTLDQALSLLASTTDLYLSPTVFTGAQVATTNRSLASMFSPTAWSVVYSGTVTAGQYLFSFTAPSNLVTAVQAGTQEADIYMTYAGGGGSTLTCKLEGYIFNPATTSSVDYAETSASFAVAKSATLPTTPQRLTAVIPYATNLVGNARYQIRVKAITASSVTSVTMWGGSNTISFVKLPVSKDVAVGTRGALAIESADGVAGTYDSTLRKLTMPNSLVPTNDVRYLAAITNGQRGPVTIGGLSLGRTGDGYPAVLDTSLGYMFFSVNGITQMGINNVAGFEFMKKVQLDDTLTVLGAVSLSSNLSSTGSVTASNMFTAANGVTNAVSTRDPYRQYAIIDAHSSNRPNA
jgi:molybdopterin-binding protein